MRSGDLSGNSNTSDISIRDVNFYRTRILFSHKTTTLYTSCVHRGMTNSGHNKTGYNKTLKPKLNLPSTQSTQIYFISSILEHKLDEKLKD